MARIVIEIEDRSDGKVKVTATPNLETIFRMIDSGHELTPAHGYAFKALNGIRQAARDQAPTNKILIPRIGR